MAIEETKMAVEHKKRHWSLIAMMTITVIPIVAAYFLYFTGFGVPENTVNNGYLLEKPIDIRRLLADNHREILEEINRDKKWRLVLPVLDECNLACENNFFTTRQVHIRLGEKNNRLSRIAINIAGQAGEEFLEKIQANHPQLSAINIQDSSWRDWIAGSGSAINANVRPYYLLVDQEGFAMMYYTDEQHGNQLLKDIKHALKYSIDYQ